MGPRFLICISISVNTIIGIVMSQLMIPVEVALGGGGGVYDSLANELPSMCTRAPVGMHAYMQGSVMSILM